jgi:CheY-like chemotaxis protein
MQMTDENDDLMLLSEEDADAHPLAETWHILVVDDDDDVHVATEFSLKRVTIRQRPLRFTHASSGAEAIALLERLDDVHLLLLDMVMERPDAGLEVARWLREEAGRRELPTIVLRSGQPGTLARSEVLGNPHINAFIEKQSATREALIQLLSQHLKA